MAGPSTPESGSPAGGAPLRPHWFEAPSCSKASVRPPTTLSADGCQVGASYLRASRGRVKVLRGSFKPVAERVEPASRWPGACEGKVGSAYGKLRPRRGRRGARQAELRKVLAGGSELASGWFGTSRGTSRRSRWVVQDLPRAVQDLPRAVRNLPREVSDHPVAGWQVPAGRFRPPAGRFRPPAGGFRPPAGGFGPPAGGSEAPVGGVEVATGRFETSRGRWGSSWWPLRDGLVAT